MFDDQKDVKKALSTIVKIYQDQGDTETIKLISGSNIYSEAIDYDNWNGGTTYYSIYIEVDATLFASYEPQLKNIEEKIKRSFEIFLRGVEGEELVNIIIKPLAKHYIEWYLVSDMTNKSELLKKIEEIKDIMIKVATGRERIESLNAEYKYTYKEIDDIFEKLDVHNPNEFDDLWKWYSQWSSGELPKYQQRREYIISLYSETIDQIKKSDDRIYFEQPYELTGWERVDRGISELRKRMREANTEEQYQSVGLLSRELIISLAQEVYDSNIHLSADGVTPSKTDAGRMLNDYFNHELSGSSKESFRRYSKSTLSLANDLTHRRSANMQEASICVIAVISLVNIIKVITDRHNIRF